MTKLIRQPPKRKKVTNRPAKTDSGKKELTQPTIFCRKEIASQIIYDIREKKRAKEMERRRKHERKKTDVNGTDPERRTANDSDIAARDS